jgi:hypothetical protein
VRAVQPGALGYMQPPALSRDASRSMTGPQAPTLRSSARGILVFIAVFLVSLAVLLFLAWRFLTRGERRAGKAAEDFGGAFNLT